jgi:hypothetical protein
MRDYDDDSGERTVSELEELHGTLKEIHATLKSRFDWPSWAGVIFAILFLNSWSGSKIDRFTDRLWYSVSTGTEWKNITVNKRPSDCDFLSRPPRKQGLRVQEAGQCLW